jgi:hypothetical protein
MIFPEDQKVRELVKQHNNRIKKIVAEELGYDLPDIAVIPEIIRTEDIELAVNLLPLELVIDSGSRASENAQNHVDNIVVKLAKLDGFGELEFGVWLRPMYESKFAGHNLN